MRAMTRTALSVACGLVLATGMPARAAVKLPHLFSDHMVLQRDLPVPVWGTATPGEAVTVSVGDKTAQATAGKDGRWMVKLGAMPAGGPVTMQVKGTNTIAIKDVLVGEVWVCSGQSNMQWGVRSSMNARAEIAAAKHPKIRLFTVPRVPAAAPVDDVNGRWVACSPQTVAGFSAVGYFFGRDLHQAIKVPVGLINTSWGGTVAEAWTSSAGLSAEPSLKPMADAQTRRLIGYAKALEELAPTLSGWRAEAEKAVAGKKPVPPLPVPHLPGGMSHNYPTMLYNGMIAPLVPYAIGGAIWYQGESNAGRAYQYRALFAAMIRDWRTQWGQGDFPFLFVQLANYTTVSKQPQESAWAELREAQTMALRLPKTGMAVIIDIGEAHDIHPRNKQDVGKRLSLAARGVAFGEKDFVYSGPMYDTMKVDGGKVRLTFKHTGGGLVAKDGPLKGFAVAGKDKRFVWAEATIDGDAVVVSSPTVAQPVAVRYAWANNPVCNLYNKEGLPAGPFRTDDWPGVTGRRRRR